MTKEQNMAERTSLTWDGDINTIVLSDEMIHHEAGLGVISLGQKSDQTQDDNYRVGHAARHLGHIVPLAKQTIPGVSLS